MFRKGKWLITPDSELKGWGELEHVRIYSTASVVWFGRQLLNTVVEQVLQKTWTFSPGEHLPTTAEEGGWAPSGMRVRLQDGGAPI